MLNSLRNSTKGLWAKILLGLLILSFAVWGIEDMIMRAGSGSAVMTVGDVEVSQVDYMRELQRQQQALRRQLGDAMTPELLAQLGLPEQTLATLSQRSLLTHAAHRYHLYPSDQAIADTVQHDTMFKNEKGEFDAALFKELLQRNKISEKQFVSTLKQEIAISLLVDTLLAHTPNSNVITNTVFAMENEQRKADIIMLPISKAKTPDAPTAETLEAFFKRFETQYTQPEFRGFSYVLIDNAALEKSVEVTDKQVRALYDERVALFGDKSVAAFEDVAPDLRKETKAEAVKARMEELSGMLDDALAEGKSLEEAAEMTGLPLHSVAPVNREGSTIENTTPIQDNSYREALLAYVFSADREAPLYVEGLSDTIAVVARIDDVNEARQQTFEEVEDTVLQDWQIHEKKAALQKQAVEMIKKLESPDARKATLDNSNASLFKNIRLSRNSTKVSGRTLPKSLVPQVYAQGVDSITSPIPDADGNQWIAIINERLGASKPTAEERNNLEGVLMTMYQNEIIQHYLDHINATTSVTVNQRLVEALSKP